jgi:hypothetical protein
MRNALAKLREAGDVQVAPTAETIPPHRRSRATLDG